MPSVLPDIVEVARQHGLEIRHRQTHNGDYRANCPFCKRNGLTPDRKYHLYLAPADKPGRYQNAFHCFRCGEEGGVAKFIALLTGRTEDEVVEEFRQRWWQEYASGKKPRPRHPAESLTEEQIRRTGLMDYRPDWRGWWRANPTATKKVLDALWEAWEEYLYPHRVAAFAVILKGIEDGIYDQAVLYVGAYMSKRIGHDLLSDVLTALSSKQWPKWAVEAARIRKEIQNEKGGKTHGKPQKRRQSHRNFPRNSSRLSTG